MDATLTVVDHSFYILTKGRGKTFPVKFACLPHIIMTAISDNLTLKELTPRSFHIQPEYKQPCSFGHYVDLCLLHYGLCYAKTSLGISGQRRPRSAYVG